VVSGIAPLREELCSSAGAPKVGVGTLSVGCNVDVVSAGVLAGLASVLGVVSGNESTDSLLGVGCNAVVAEAGARTGLVNGLGLVSGNASTDSLLRVGCNAVVAEAGARTGLVNGLDAVSGNESTPSLPGADRPFWVNGHPVMSVAARLVAGAAMPTVNFINESWLL